MKVLLLGCGHTAPATAHYLLNCHEVKQVTLIDASHAALKKASKHFPFLRHKKLNALQLDIKTTDILTACMKDHDLIAASLPWPATRLAILSAIKTAKPFVSITRPHYLDLIELNNLAESKNSLIMLGCGLEPGLTEIMAHRAIKHFSTVEELHLRCGGIPQNPQPPLNYKIVFNSNSLPMEPRPAYCIENGMLKTVPRFSGIDSIYIEPLGFLEAWHDGMLPWLVELPLLNQAKSVTQKTLRWPGFAYLSQLFAQLGFLNKKPISYEGKLIIPKQFLDTLLEPQSRFTTVDRDISLLQIEANGKQGKKTISYQAMLITYYDESSHLTAMAQTTGYTLGAITQLIGNGEITGQGLLRPEKVFIDKAYTKLQHALAQMGITFKEKIF